MSIRTLINAHHDYVMHAAVNSHDMNYSIAHVRNPDGKTLTIRVPYMRFIVHMLLTIDSIESVASF